MEEICQVHRDDSPTPATAVGTAVAATVHVDPSCPFAWITRQWLGEVERLGAVELTVELLSLAVINEHRDIDPWYRTFNDLAWAPARIMAAVSQEHGRGAGDRFYRSFGTRFHVELGTSDDADREQLAVAALADAGLPASLAAAGRSTRWDDDLRVAAAEVLGRLGLDVGVPLLEIGGRPSSGPVLSQIPRGPAAVELFAAIRTLAGQDGFIRFERQRRGELQTS